MEMEVNTTERAMSQVEKLGGHSSYLYSTRVLGLVLLIPLRMTGKVGVFLLVISSPFPEKSFKGRGTSVIIQQLIFRVLNFQPRADTQIHSLVWVCTSQSCSDGFRFCRQMALGSGGNMSNRNSMYTQSPSSSSPIRILM